ncbi:MAG: hypothetical protein Q9207_002814 [Kuettlingeria erythrocarpa]
MRVDSLRQALLPLLVQSNPRKRAPSPPAPTRRSLMAEINKRQKMAQEQIAARKAQARPAELASKLEELEDELRDTKALLASSKDALKASRRENAQLRASADSVSLSQELEQARVKHREQQEEIDELKAALRRFCQHLPALQHAILAAQRRRNALLENETRIAYNKFHREVEWSLPLVPAQEETAKYDGQESPFDQPASMTRSQICGLIDDKVPSEESQHGSRIPGLGELTKEVSLGRFSSFIGASQAGVDSLDSHRLKLSGQRGGPTIKSEFTSQPSPPPPGLEPSVVSRSDTDQLQTFRTFRELSTPGALSEGKGLFSLSSIAKLKSQAKSTPNPTQLKVPLSSACFSADGAMIPTDESANKSFGQPSTPRTQIQPAILSAEQMSAKTTNPPSSSQRQQPNASFPTDTSSPRVEGTGTTAATQLAPQDPAQFKFWKSSMGPASMAKPTVSAYCKMLALKGRLDAQRSTVSEPATKPGPSSPWESKLSSSTGKVNASMTAAEVVKKPAPEHVEGGYDPDPNDEEWLRKTAAFMPTGLHLVVVR